jgi:hypothetical protein
MTADRDDAACTGAVVRNPSQTQKSGSATVRSVWCPISRHRAHGGAELRWNADTFAEMHRSIAVAACEE